MQLITKEYILWSLINNFNIEKKLIYILSCDAMELKIYDYIKIVEDENVGIAIYPVEFDKVQYITFIARIFKNTLFW